QTSGRCRQVENNMLLSTMSDIFHTQTFQYTVWSVNFATAPIVPVSYRLRELVRQWARPQSVTGPARLSRRKKVGKFSCPVAVAVFPYDCSKNRLWAKVPVTGRE